MMMYLFECVSEDITIIKYAECACQAGGVCIRLFFESDLADRRGSLPNSYDATPPEVYISHEDMR